MNQKLTDKRKAGMSILAIVISILVIASAIAVWKIVSRVDDEGIKIIESSKSKKDYECGHKRPASYAISFYGLETKTIEDEDRCPECFIEDVDATLIRCCLCRLPILPGDPIALYAGAAGLQKDIATRYKKQWVGCMRWDCCPTGGAFAGHWTGEEIRPAFGGHSAAAEVVRTGEPITISF